MMVFMRLLLGQWSKIMQTQYFARLPPTRSWWPHSCRPSCRASARAACPRQTGWSWCSGPGSAAAPHPSSSACRQSCTWSPGRGPAPGYLYLYIYVSTYLLYISTQLYLLIHVSTDRDVSHRRVQPANRTVREQTSLENHFEGQWWKGRHHTSSITTTSSTSKCGCPVSFILDLITRQLYRSPSLYGLFSPQGRC